MRGDDWFESYVSRMTADMQGMLASMPYPNAVFNFGERPRPQAQPQDLKNPCVDCPFRTSHHHRYGLRVIEEKLRDTQAHRSLCHMGEQQGHLLTCEGSRLFMLPSTDPGIIHTASELLALRR